jgi:hypothetical protein
LGGDPNRRPGLPLAPRVQPAPRGLQPLLAALRGRELARQLVTATVAELLVLGRVDLSRLPQRLFGELVVVARRALRRVGVHPRAIDRQHHNVRQTSLRAEPEDLPEQRRQRALVALAEPGDRRVIRLPVRRNDPVGDVLEQPRSITREERCPRA